MSKHCILCVRSGLSQLSSQFKVVADFAELATRWKLSQRAVGCQ